MEPNNEMLINNLLSLKHVLASFHDTVEDYIISLEENELLQDENDKLNEKLSHSTCGCGNAKPSEYLKEVMPKQKPSKSISIDPAELFGMKFKRQ